MEFIDKLAWVRIENKKILSTRSKWKDAYYIPGGKREKITDTSGLTRLESDQQALVREIKEELDVDLVPATIKFMGEFKTQAHGKALGTLVRMRCYTADYTGDLKPSGEIEEMVWLAHSDKEKTAPVDIIIMDWLHKKGLID